MYVFLFVFRTYAYIAIKIKLGNSLPRIDFPCSSFFALLPFIYDVNLFLLFSLQPTSTFPLCRVRKRVEEEEEEKERVQAENAGKIELLSITAEYV
jgi:hypothetical protein